MDIWPISWHLATTYSKPFYARKKYKIAGKYEPFVSGSAFGFRFVSFRLYQNSVASNFGSSEILVIHFVRFRTHRFKAAFQAVQFHLQECKIDSKMLAQNHQSHYLIPRFRNRKFFSVAFEMHFGLSINGLCDFI